MSRVQDSLFIVPAVQMKNVTPFSQMSTAHEDIFGLTGWNCFYSEIQFDSSATIQFTSGQLKNDNCCPHRLYYKKARIGIPTNQEF